MEIITEGFAGGFAADNGNTNGSRIFECGVEEFCPGELTADVDEAELGRVRSRSYFSTSCGLERRVNVLLPANMTEGRKYPVLYMLHGIFGDENSFLNDKNNKLPEITVNMVKKGICGETIIVFPNMYASFRADQKPGMNSEDIKPYDFFINDLVNDLMPFIEREFPVLTGRENTALAGFSMGGRETLFIALKHPELFANICSISAAPGLVPGRDWAMEHVGQLSEDEVRFAPDALLPDRFIVCCGTKDSVVGRFPLSYHELFEKNGIKHIWYEVTDADHDNNAIRSGYYNVLKQMAGSSAGA